METIRMLMLASYDPVALKIGAADGNRTGSVGTHMQKGRQKIQNGEAEKNQYSAEQFQR